MEGKEAIIAKIIGDARKKAEENIANAEKYANDLTVEAEKYAEQYSAEKKVLLEKEAKENVERRAIVADLDVRKLLLGEKQKILTEVYNKTCDKLCKLDKKNYLTFIEKLISDYADEGDEVELSRDGVVSVDDVKKLSCVKTKNLSVRVEKGDFIGGVKLIGKISDKDLTFKSVVAENSELYSAEIATILF